MNPGSVTLYAGYNLCQASQLRSESPTRKCQWLETLEWKVLALHKGLGLDLFLGCVTLPGHLPSLSFHLSLLPLRQASKNRRVAAMEREWWQR